MPMPGTPEPATPERIRRFWDSHAGSYDRDMAFLDRVLFGGGRAWVCRQAAGTVLEVAVGTGRNLAHYPDAVTLTGIDLSPAMLEIARRRAAELGVDIDLRVGDAQALEFPDGVFDTVVCTLSLCGIPDPQRAIDEMKRVLRPGGRLLLLDHVAGTGWAVRAAQRGIEMITVRLAGEHLLRRPLREVQAAGLVLERRDRYRRGIVERLVASKPPALD
jgi:ubiquinone/menaquinone biosynthesis C-methylase UbiE